MQQVGIPHHGAPKTQAKPLLASNNDADKVMGFKVLLLCMLVLFLPVMHNTHFSKKITLSPLVKDGKIGHDRVVTWQMWAPWGTLVCNRQDIQFGREYAASSTQAWYRGFR